MKRIFKYRLPRDGEVIRISANVHKWLEIHEQNGWPHIWAIVEEDGSPRQYEIVAWGTGWEWPEEMNWTSYLGTCGDMDGYVWHYFMQETTPSFAADRAYDYDYLGTLTGNLAETDYTVTISCGEADSAISALETKTTYDVLTNLCSYVEGACNSAVKTARM